jgi:hypothetical protein
MSAPPGHMWPAGGSPGKKVSQHDSLEASPGAHTHSKYVGPTLAETVHASERFEKAGLLAAHLAALHDAHMLERGLLPGTSLPDSEAPPIPPVYAESPWKELKPLSLVEMKVGKTHRRHFLEGRLCAKSLKVTSVVSEEAEEVFRSEQVVEERILTLFVFWCLGECVGGRVGVGDEADFDECVAGEGEYGASAELLPGGGAGDGAGSLPDSVSGRRGGRVGGVAERHCVSV